MGKTPAQRLRAAPPRQVSGCVLLIFFQFLSHSETSFSNPELQHQSLGFVYNHCEAPDTPIEFENSGSETKTKIVNSCLMKGRVQMLKIFFLFLSRSASGQQGRAVRRFLPQELPSHSSKSSRKSNHTTKFRLQVKRSPLHDIGEKQGPTPAFGQLLRPYPEVSSDFQKTIC
ncbi:hypothetical protein HNY73_000414 [Argiope bruennichi]|uniref:Uncharacterized protein n=1 Tax=Argiope bruennichi TaxID=94029 RepID=A0A8T0G1V7_ARGBR|nr:hypothetical protein HNY73_000414 [Argiope bruennichi]